MAITAEHDVEQEHPLVIELRTMAERLNELADKLAEQHGLERSG